MITANKQSVGHLVAENLARAQVFEKYHIDYCCHGQKTLEEVCGERGLSVDTLVSELDSSPATGEACDWPSASLTKLADHIVERHHAYLRSALPSIAGKLDKVIEAHSDRHGGSLRRLREIGHGLGQELTQHMMKEEMMLFPLIRQMEAAERDGVAPPAAPGGSVNNPIRMMEHEHDTVGRVLEEIRALTSGYVPPPEACNTFRALYAQLEELEGDLHAHIHLENNILFPRASELEARLGKGGP